MAARKTPPRRKATPTPRRTSTSPPAGPEPADAPLPADAAPARQRRARQSAVPMQVRTPTVGATGRGAPKTKAPPQPAFWYIFNIDRWDVFGDAEPRVLPSLSKAKLQPGANGVARDRGGRPLPDMMLAQIAANGHTVIPWDVDGPGTSYLQQDSATGGWYGRWESVFPGSSAILEGGAPYHDWLASLIERGILPPPPIYVLQRLLGRYAQLAGESASDPRKALVHQRYQRCVDAIRTELAEAEAELAEPEPEPDLPTPNLEPGTPELGDGPVAAGG